MQRKRKTSKKTSWIAKGIFIALVIASGFALYSTNNIDDPFDGMLSMLQVNEMMPSDAEFASLQASSTDASTTDTVDTTDATADTSTTEAVANTTTDSESSRPTPPDGEGFERPEGGPDGGGHSSGLSWSQIGGVLYNLWFICAVVAIIMVIGSPIGKLIKMVKPQRNSSAAATVTA